MKTSNITRRRFVAASSAVAAAAMLPSRSARAAEFEYKMGHSSPAGHPFHKRLLEVSERIDKGTNGRMKLSIFPASQLGGDNDLLSQARSGAVDFGIATDPHAADDLYCEPLCIDPYHVVLPAQHPLAARDSVGWGELSDASVLTLDQQCGMQPAVEKALSSYHVRTSSLQLLGHFAAVFGMVALGLGIGVVPSRASARRFISSKSSTVSLYTSATERT